jgi:hypothetical protein
MRFQIRNVYLSEQKVLDFKDGYIGTESELLERVRDGFDKMLIDMGDKKLTTQEANALYKWVKDIKRGNNV